MWTAERIAGLRQMIEVLGLTFDEAARRLGTTRNACIGAAHRNGIKRRKSTPFTTAGQPRRALVGLHREVKARAAPTVDPFPPKGHCVYPMGHPGEAGFRFCREAVGVAGEPYCTPHRGICLTVPIAPKEKGA